MCNLAINIRPSFPLTQWSLTRLYLGRPCPMFCTYQLCQMGGYNKTLFKCETHAMVGFINCPSPPDTLCDTRTNSHAEKFHLIPSNIVALATVTMPPFWMEMRLSLLSRLVPERNHKRIFTSTNIGHACSIAVRIALPQDLSFVLR